MPTQQTTSDLSLGSHPPFKKVGRSRINTIYQAIRDRICFFECPPGTVLREGALAEEFGVSRTPIRQILQRLESEKLVEIRDGVGTIVTGVDFRRLRDVYDLRLKITALIGEMGRKGVSLAAVEEVHTLISRAEKLRADPDIHAFWAIESDRHRLINSLIVNEPFREIHDSLYTQTARVWYDIVESVWTEAHAALTAELNELERALSSGDLTAVAYTSRNYIAYSMARLARHFDPT